MLWALREKSFDVHIKGVTVVSDQLKRSYKVKYITNHYDFDFHDGIQLNIGKFYVEATDIEEAICIVKKKLEGFLSDTANVYITSVKEVK